MAWETVLCAKLGVDMFVRRHYLGYLQMRKISSSVYILVLLLSLLLFMCPHAMISNGAFCRKNVTDRANFPLSVPKTFLTPWVWDAIENTMGKTIEITVVSRRACWFNHTQWEWAIRWIPKHSKYFAYGSKSNILVEPEEPPNNSGRKAEGLYLERIDCIFYNNSNPTPIAKTKSQVINGNLDWLRYGTVQVVCPSPTTKYDVMRIERNTKNSDTGSSVLLLDSQSNSLIRSISDEFPVCQMNELIKDIVYTNTDKKGRYYGISVCTATGRVNRSSMVEWIEYHKHLGVDHFFIYFTSLTIQHEVAYATLSDYIMEGIVTIVPWGYENCVRGMASGRWCHWRNASLPVFFQPPRAIAQSAALASCYSRFRRFTKYMVHIDDDEFIVMNSSLANPKSTNNSGSRKKRKFQGALYEYANRIFLQNPKSAAIRFSPIGKYHCPSVEFLGEKEHMTQVLNESESSRLQKSILPRIGKYLVSQKQSVFESKLLMKTDAVRMFFIHYLSQLEAPYKSYDPIVIDMREVVILHYKIAPIITGDIWGQQLINRKWPKESRPCNDFKRSGGYKENIKNGYFQPTGEDPDILPIPHNTYTFIQKIDIRSTEILEKNYLERMSKVSIQ